MRTRTTAIQGSDEVLARWGHSGHFYRGKWEDVKVTEISTDEETPLEVRKSLVGLIVPTIFTKEQIEAQTSASLPIPEESRLAYAPDVIEVLSLNGKHEEADQLKKIIPNPLDMYVFERETYELVG